MNDSMMHKPLPSRTQLVADVIGRERALFLVRNWKRTLSTNPKAQILSIYIPVKLSPDHELVRVMGWPDASKLVAAFRGEILNLSTCEDVFRSWRNMAIRELHAEQGLKPQDLAEWFELTDRQVRNILREIPSEARVH
ncbi:hypothetical protein [Dyella sp.]|uniref:hypothetical protein n=1 Tax=Dyella sp. TaxID=1869338 RepID=UPI00284B3B74|nr:hypothetical protein [Dyella sp.]MDR3445732.1 hypothetical protein [Dyella sp.]MDR3548461.1 hypothetical protein [Candidatus Paceibacterota bacterium]